jgi:RNA polymerase sigma-70 factor (ECF subfamily)
MADGDWLAERFESNRTHLRAVAYRMLGSQSEADDAVQEAWLRFSRAGSEQVENLGGWLTTIVARVCLDMLRTRKSRREEPLGLQVAEPVAAAEPAGNPEHEALLADSIGLALLVVLEALNPAERVAFVLHDMFAVPFEDVGDIVGRSPAAARQLASRARRRVQGADTVADVDVRRQREIVNAFLAASRAGDFEGLIALLDPDVVVRADATVAAMGAEPELRGAQLVATTYNGRARAARPALLGGMPGLVWMHRGQTQVAFSFTIAQERIVRIDLIGDADHLSQLVVMPSAISR